MTAEDLKQRLPDFRQAFFFADSIQDIDPGCALASP